MKGLRRADLEAVLGFLGHAAELESDEAYSPELLERLQDLIRCNAILYREYEYRARRPALFIGIGRSGPFQRGSAVEPPPEPEREGDDDLYWRKLGPCPIVHYRASASDLEAVRMSDVVSGRRFRDLPIYQDYFRVGGVNYLLDVGLRERPPRQRSLLLCRQRGERDFTERDRAVLELLRPHLYRLEDDAALRRALADARRDYNADDAEEAAYSRLTPREREIVELVGQGKTNAEIAAALWVAPSTVKKHLDNIYAKLGVRRRAAVAAAHSTSR